MELNTVITLWLRREARTDLNVRSAYVHMLSSAATDAIDQMRAIKINMKQRRDELNQARAAADAALVSVRADEQAAMAADSQLRATLAKVKGDLASLITQEESARTARNQANASRGL